MKEKELFIKALGNLFHSWAGDTPTSVYETGNMLLKWYEQEYNVVLSIRFERDEDWEDNYDEVIEAIEKSDKNGRLQISQHSIDLINELISEGWEFFLHQGDDLTWEHMDDYHWCVDFTRITDEEGDKIQRAYSDSLDDAVRKVHFNIRNEKKYVSAPLLINRDITKEPTEKEIDMYLAQSWWNDLADEGLCDDMLKKYNHYGHDIGVNINDLVDIYLQENKNTEE